MKLANSPTLRWCLIDQILECGSIVISRYTSTLTQSSVRVFFTHKMIV